MRFLHLIEMETFKVLYILKIVSKLYHRQKQGSEIYVSRGPNRQPRSLVTASETGTHPFYRRTCRFPRFPKGCGSHRCRVRMNNIRCGDETFCINHLGLSSRTGTEVCRSYRRVPDCTPVWFINARESSNPKRAATFTSFAHVLQVQFHMVYDSYRFAMA